MPYTWTVDAARGLVTITADGMIDFDSSVEVIRNLVASPEFNPRFGVLLDVREAAAAPTFEELNAFAELLSQLGFFKGRTALVVSSSSDFTKARQLGSFGEDLGLTIEAFTSIRSALRWLGVPE
jgi:hypothetical protein